MSTEYDDDALDTLVDVTHDGYMRNISIHIHLDRPMLPHEFMAELALIVADYQECPEELFMTASVEEPQ